MIFEDLEEFVTAHRPCGGLTSDVGEPTATGYDLRVACSSGATFDSGAAPRCTATWGGIPADTVASRCHRPPQSTLTSPRAQPGHSHPPFGADGLLNQG